MPQSPVRRHLLKLCTALGTTMVLSTLCAGTAQAQTATKIRFQLDWRFEGPSAL
ncbi:MAG: taurine ABC transporter permease, partial [Cupriavidus sp.]|nr:taurine ABC transporter permease [Cupriavidus sp.]